MHFFLLTVLVVSITLASSTVPICAGTWCADVKEVLYINETISSSQAYNLCMNRDILNWRRTNADGSWTMLNTASNRLYSVTAHGVCTVTIPNGPADPTQLPFSFMTIDQAAHMDGEGDSPDSGILSTKYYHDRSAYISNGVSIPSEQMYWYLRPTTDSSDDYQMVETVCQQTYDITPGDGGTQTTQSGNRDFSSNYNVISGSSQWNYKIPPDITCQEPAAQDQELGEAFGPILF